MDIVISIPLPPYLREYLRNFFYVRNNQMYANNKNHIGRYLNCLLQECQSFETGQEGVKIVLQDNTRKNSKYKRNWLSQQDQSRFVDYVRAHFDNEYMLWLNVATELGLDRMTAYNYFLQSRGISVDSKNIEALKKKDYRWRRKMRDEFAGFVKDIVSQHNKKFNVEMSHN